MEAQSLKPQFPSSTFPNHYSIITGLYPANHGIISNSFINPFNKKVYNKNRPNVTESEWYKGEAFWETARKNGIISGVYFWVGSEMDDLSRQPTYTEPYEHNRPYEKRVEGVLDWLKMPDSLRPQFIALYFDEPDSKGHHFGVNSDSLNFAIKKVDNMLEMLDSGLISLDMKDKVNLIVLSDHGMTNLYPDKMIWINKILDTDSTKVEFMNKASYGWLFVKDSTNIQKIYDRLKENEEGYKVYLSKDVPKRLHTLEHPFFGDIMILPELGYSLRDIYGWSDLYQGTHGYDNELIDMHGIFVARGPAFKSNYKIGEINNLDIYPLLCKIFNIEPKHKIDGDLNRIIHILKE